MGGKVRDSSRNLDGSEKTDGISYSMSRRHKIDLSHPTWKHDEFGDDFVKLKAMMELSKEAYVIRLDDKQATEPSEIDAFKAEHGFDNIKSFKKSNVIITNDIIFVSFTGTETIKDMMRDVRPDKKIDEHVPGGGKIHAGFYENIKESYDDICKYLEDKIKGKRIYVNGHSLGGATAVIFAARIATRCLNGEWKDKDVKCIRCYTFGSPRVCDERYRDIIEKDYSIDGFLEIERCSSTFDAVTRAPTVAIKFRHVGRSRYISYFNFMKELNFPLREFDGVASRVNALAVGGYIRHCVFGAFPGNFRRIPCDMWCHYCPGVGVDLEDHNLDVYYDKILAIEQKNKSCICSGDMANDLCVMTFISACAICWTGPVLFFGHFISRKEGHVPHQEKIGKKKSVTPIEN